MSRLLELLRGSWRETTHSDVKENYHCASPGNVLATLGSSLNFYFPPTPPFQRLGGASDFDGDTAVKAAFTAAVRESG